MRDDDDDTDDDPEFDRPTAFPGVVKAAGIVWIGVGALSLLNMVAALVLAGANAQPGGMAGGLCPGLIGFAFLWCGYQTVTGKAADTLGNGIGSIVLGLLELTAAVVLTVGGALAGAGGGAGKVRMGEVMLVVAVVVGMLGLTLVVAGILALVGRTRYKEWRRATRPRKPNRRRRDRDDDDDDDRPRRPRRPRDDDD